MMEKNNNNGSSEAEEVAAGLVAVRPKAKIKRVKRRGSAGIALSSVEDDLLPEEGLQSLLEIKDSMESQIESIDRAPNYLHQLVDYIAQTPEPLDSPEQSELRTVKCLVAGKEKLISNAFTGKFSISTFSGLLGGAAKNYKRLYLEEKERNAEIERQFRQRYGEQRPISVTFLGEQRTKETFWNEILNDVKSPIRASNEQITFLSHQFYPLAFTFSWVDLDAGLDDTGDADHFDHPLWKEQLRKAYYLNESHCVFMLDLRGIDDGRGKHSLLRNRAIQFAYIAAKSTGSQVVWKPPQLPTPSSMKEILRTISRNDYNQTGPSVPIYFAIFSKAARRLDSKTVDHIFPEPISTDLIGSSRRRDVQNSSTDDSEEESSRNHLVHDAMLTKLRDHFELFQKIVLHDFGVFSYTSDLIAIPKTRGADSVLALLESANLFRSPSAFL